MSVGFGETVRVSFVGFVVYGGFKKGAGTARPRGQVRKPRNAGTSRPRPYMRLFLNPRYVVRRLPGMGLPTVHSAI